uniref:Uncharacterized protein n=1 Tax=Lepeophtheirus salmonis TaxID=72036 RepID=A0A0K2T442_LEPSM
MLCFKIIFIHIYFRFVLCFCTIISKKKKNEISQT